MGGVLKVIRLFALLAAMFGFAIMIKDHFTELSPKMTVDTNEFNKKIKNIDHTSVESRIELSSKAAEPKTEHMVKPGSLTAKELSEIILIGEVNKLDSLLNVGMDANIM